MIRRAIYYDHNIYKIYLVLFDIIDKFKLTHIDLEKKLSDKDKCIERKMNLNFSWEEFIWTFSYKLQLKYLVKLTMYALFKASVKVTMYAWFK